MKGKVILIATGILSLFACNNEDNVEPINFKNPAFSIVGRWYTEKTDNPDLDMYAEYTFTADGAVYVDEYRRRNGYKRNEGRGTYSVDGKKIVTNMETNKGLPIQNVSEIQDLNSLKFITKNKEYGDMQYLRIVGIVTPHVGDTLNLDVQQAINSYSSQAVTIVSCTIADDAIASMDEEGVLTAKLIGVTYLKVETSIGYAVIKISVTDNQNLWNDFSKGLGKSFEEVEKLFGKHYAFKNDSLIRYFYDNIYVDSVDIYRHDNITDSIVVAFRETVDKECVNNYLKEKLFFVKDTLSYHWYTDNNNYLFSSFSAKFFETEKKLRFTRLEPNWDDRANDYNLTFDELEKKYGLHFAYKDSKMVTFEIKNDFVGRITYFLNPKVQYYIIYINSNIKDSLIYDYLKKKYIYSFWNGNWFFLQNIQIKGKEMLLQVSPEKNNSRVIYYKFIENE